MSSEDDEILIQNSFDDLLQHCQGICKSPDDVDFIRRAFNFANEAHHGVKRRSGEPYMMHPLAVAKIIIKEVGLGIKSVVVALLHDVVEDTEYTLEDIEYHFGPKISSMVDGLTKLSGAVDTKDVSLQAENFKKVILTLTDDIRVIIIKIADRLHNMRTLQYMPEYKQVKIASETMYLFAPLAHRLGLYAIKTELEDLSFCYLYHDEYLDIKNKISDKEGHIASFIDEFKKPIEEKLNQNNIFYDITSRTKSVYSIWKKMQSKGIPFSEVYDLYAIRIIFYPSDEQHEKSEAWEIYSLITDIYKSKTDRLRDWISSPKTNGYEALHCTLMSNSGNWVEVQIRSKRMDDIAELGFAAHWSYKAKEILNDTKDIELENWLIQLRETLNNPSKDAVAFLDKFEQHLQVSSMTIFTPKGEVKTLPRNATALDFAYEIHSRVGNTAIGAKINYKLSSLYTELHPGDQVEIITSESGTPEEEWLLHVVTAKAKSYIKAYLSQAQEGEIRKGREIFEAMMNEKSIKLQKRLYVKLLPAFHLKTKEALFIKIANGQISSEEIYAALRSSTSTKSVKYWTLKILSLGSYNADSKDDNEDFDEESAKQASSNNIKSMEPADCCSPIPGDAVIGFKFGNSIQVHKKTCPNAIKLSVQHADSVVDVKWSGEKVMSYLAKFEFNGVDRPGIVMELAKIIASEYNINMRDVEIHSHDGIYEGNISLYVKNQDDLIKVMNKISDIKGMEHVARVSN